MKVLVGLICLFLLSNTCLSWFGSEETTTTAPSATEQASTTTTTATTSDSKASTISSEGSAATLGETTTHGDAETTTEAHSEQVAGETTEGEVLDGEYTENPLDSVDFYMYSAKDMSGEDFSLEAYRGYVTLVVNVASKCGYTDSTYKDLVALQSKFEPTGVFTVLAFPCNQFWEQEPGTNEDIFKFATENYSANFPMFGKTDVTGDNATDAWHYLAQATGYAPQWNFWKYLVDQNGHVVDVWSHETPAIELEGWIEDAISKAIAQAEGTGEYADYEAGAGENDTTTVHDHDHGGEL